MSEFEKAMKKVIDVLHEDTVEIEDEKGRGWIIRQFLDAQCYWANKQIQWIEREQLPDTVARLRAEHEKRGTDVERVERYSTWVRDAETRLKQYQDMQSIFELMYENETGDKYVPKTSRDVLDKTNTAAHAEAKAILERYSTKQAA